MNRARLCQVNFVSIEILLKIPVSSSILCNHCLLIILQPKVQKNLGKTKGYLKKCSNSLKSDCHCCKLQKMITSTVPSGKLNLFCTTEVSSLILLPFSPRTFCVLVARIMISVRVGVTRTSTPLQPSSASSLVRKLFSSALNTPSATNCKRQFGLVTVYCMQRIEKYICSSNK